MGPRLLGPVLRVDVLCLRYSGCSVRVAYCSWESGGGDLLNSVGGCQLLVLLIFLVGVASGVGQFATFLLTFLRVRDTLKGSSRSAEAVLRIVLAVARVNVLLLAVGTVPTSVLLERMFPWCGS